MSSHAWIRSSQLGVLVLVSACGGFACAQDRPLPKVEVFGGYSYVYPHATITGTLPGGITPVSSCLCAIPEGAGGAVTFNFNHWLGLTADVSGHWASQGATQADKISRASFFTAAAGPRLTYRSRHFAPFAEVLAGEQRLSPQLFSAENAFGLLVGGGLDVSLGRHLAARPVEVDYAFSNYQFGSQAGVAGTDVRGIRLQTGLVFQFGGQAHHAMPAAAAAAAPASAEALSAMPAPVPAPMVAPVVAMPLLQCAASPMTMMAGQSTTITAIGTSASNRPLAYSFSSNAGTISGEGATAVLSTAGVSAGTVLVTCNVADDTGQKAVVTVPVMLTALAAAPVTASSALCTMSFARDVRRPARVDNEAKACLDDIALSLQRSSDATLVLIAGASDGNQLASQRAVNTKAYLVQDKGLNPSRISLYSDPQGGTTVSTIIVPAGATPDVSSFTPINEATVKVQPRSTAVHSKPATR